MPDQNIPKLVFGVVDAMITDVFERLPSAFSGGDIVITCRDSTPVLEALSLESLAKDGINSEAGYAAVRIHKAAAVEFMKMEIFEGFDELFIVKAGSSLAPYSSAAPMLRIHNRQAIIAKLFDEAGALRYFSDGLGLHYAVEPDLGDALNRTFPPCLQA